jgi:hypothetical protein
VHDLLELTVIDSGFVSGLVDAVLDEAIAEGMQAVSRIVAAAEGERTPDQEAEAEAGAGGRRTVPVEEGEAGEVEGGEDLDAVEGGREEGRGGGRRSAVDAPQHEAAPCAPPRWEEAQRELRQMAAVLVALAGVDRLRDRLAARLVEPWATLSFGLKMIAMTARLVCKSLSNGSQWQCLRRMTVPPMG